MTAPVGLSGEAWDAAQDAAVKAVTTGFLRFPNPQEFARHILRAALPVLRDAIRREVWLECVAIAARDSEEARHRNGRTDACKIAAENAAHECGEAIEVALRALLPPPPGDAP